MTSLSSITEQVRITRVYHYDSTSCKFSSSPLKDRYKLKSADHYVVVESPSSSLPMEPRVGQIWEITGKPEYTKVTKPNIVLHEVKFNNPDKFEVLLPESDEQFIKFIALQKDFVGIGAGKARELWDKFGRSVFKLIDDNDVDSLTAVLSVQS